MDGKPCKLGHRDRNVRGNCKVCIQLQQKRARDSRTEEDRERDYVRAAAKQKLRHWPSRLLKHAKDRHPDKSDEPMNITVEWIRSQPMVCPYLQVPIVPSTEAWSPWQPSLDRIDNSRGYTTDNVKLTSWQWNRMRGPMTIEEALAVLHAIRVGSVLTHEAA